MNNEKRTSEPAIGKFEDRLKAVHDKDINALLFNHTPDIRAFDVIDLQPYIGADPVIARDMDDIITFASPRNQTAQISVVCPVHASVPSGNRSDAVRPNDRH